MTKLIKSCSLFRLFKRANEIVTAAENDLGQLEYGVIVDLLADHTVWSLNVCKYVREMLVRDNPKRFCANETL